MGIGVEEGKRTGGGGVQTRDGVARECQEGVLNRGGYSPHDPYILCALYAGRS